MSVAAFEALQRRWAQPSPPPALYASSKPIIIAVADLDHLVFAPVPDGVIVPPAFVIRLNDREAERATRYAETIEAGGYNPGPRGWWVPPIQIRRRTPEEPWRLIHGAAQLHAARATGATIVRAFTKDALPWY